MTTLDIVYFNAGGGHRASALALQAIIQAQHRPWSVRLVNLVDILDPEKRFHTLLGFHPEDLYNKRLARGWTRSMGHELVVLQQLIKLGNAAMTERLQQYWQHTRPDMVISMIPNFNRAMYQGLCSAGIDAEYMTVMTDFADLDRGHFWIEPALRQHMVCGTAKAVEQARALGYAPPYLHPTSGMLVRPVFYEPPTQEREEAMLQHGLNPHLPTGVVLFGGHGSRAMGLIAQRLPDVQLIFLCGHNEVLAKKLRALPHRAPRWVQGFTSDVPSFMRMGDFLIGKPGPGSISEALVCGLPTVLIHAGNTMPQERYNVEWVLEQGVGVAFSHYRKVDEAVLKMLAQLPAYKAKVAALRNRALFELPEIIAKVLRTRRSAKASAS